MFIAINNLAKLTNWLEKFFEVFFSHLLKSKKKEVAEYKKILESNFKIAENGVFLETIILLDDFHLEKNDIDIDNNEVEDWKNKRKENEPISKT